MRRAVGVVLVAASVVAAGAGGSSVASAAPAAKPKPVTISFRIVPTPVAHAPVQGKPFVPVGDSLLLTGKAAYGNTGNAGRVDVSFRDTPEDGLVKIASVTAAADGAYQLRVPATVSGSYEVLYNGNAARQQAWADSYVTVSKDVPATEVVYAHMDTCPATTTAAGCAVTSPELTARPGPLRYVDQQICPGMPPEPGPYSQAGRIAQLTLAATFTDGEPGALPQRFRLGAWYAVFNGADHHYTQEMTPRVTRGHFVIHSAANCTYAVTVLQTHVDTVKVD
jgi:hypothetical protein